MHPAEDVTAGERVGDKAPTRCPICGQPLSPTKVRARDRMMTGDGPFTAVECPSCQFALTLPQLDDAELERYYPREYYDFQGYSDRRAAGTEEQPWRPLPTDSRREKSSGKD